MEFVTITPDDYDAFHALLTAYYREGEDADTPTEIIDSFIRSLFAQLTCGELFGCFARLGEQHVGFALWAKDTRDFVYTQMPGLGTILEIGLIPSCRGMGQGRLLAAHIETCLRFLGVPQAYVCAYGPAQVFWKSCGYIENGKIADNGLPLMVKDLA